MAAPLPYSLVKKLCPAGRRTQSTVMLTWFMSQRELNLQPCSLGLKVFWLNTHTKNYSSSSSTFLKEKALSFVRLKLALNR